MHKQTHSSTFSPKKTLLTLQKRQVSLLFKLIIDTEARINLKNYYNTNYIGILKVGNPPQEIRALFDTGSANSWILSDECKNEKTEEEKHQFFYSAKSSTFKDTGEAAKIFFGSGSLEGTFGKDDIHVVNGNGKDLVVKN